MITNNIVNKIKVAGALGAIIAEEVKLGYSSLVGSGVTIYRVVKIGYNVLLAKRQNIFSDIPCNEIVS